MRAVIMDVGPRQTIILSEEGDYIEVRTMPQYKVGHEIEYRPASNLLSFTKYASVAAVLLLAIGIGSFMYAYAAPCGYIDMEINPGIEITTNRFDYIIRVNALNSDGMAYLENVSIIHEPLKDAVALLLEQLESKKYLLDDLESTLVFSVSAGDQGKADNIESQIDEVVQHRLEDKEKLNVYIVRSSMQHHERAQKYNISSGRYLLIEQLQTTDETVSIDTLRDVSIGEVVSRAMREESAESEGEARSSRGAGKNSVIRQIMTGERREQMEAEGTSSRDSQTERQNPMQTTPPGERIRNAESETPSSSQAPHMPRNDPESRRQSERPDSGADNHEPPASEREMQREDTREPSRSRPVTGDADRDRESRGEEQTQSEAHIQRSEASADRQHRESSSNEQRARYTP